MNRRSPRPGSAFTLVELLVAVALIILVATVATTSVMQMMKMTRRLQAIQNMNSAATIIQGKLGDEVAGMHHGSAIWLRTTTNVVDPSLKDVELVFMIAQRSVHGYRTKRLAFQFQEIGTSDLLWTRWAWNAKSKVLSASTSRNARWTKIPGSATRNYWKLPAPAAFTSKTMDDLTSILAERYMPFFSVFLSIPRPVRETGLSSGTPNVPNEILDRNTWNWPTDATFEYTEMGDYTDLLRNARPILRDCSDFRLELVPRSGSAVRADQDTALTWAAPGYFIDGRNQSGLEDRPSLVRVAFTLREGDTPYDRDGTTAPGTDTRPRQSYSLSFPTQLTPAY